MTFSSRTLRLTIDGTLKSKIFVRTITLIGVWAFVSGILYLKIPTAFTKIYAEDGSISLQDALAKSFPRDFISSYAGYFDVIARISGRVVASFPLQSASQVFFFFNSLMLSWISMTIYHASSEFIRNRNARSIFSLSLILLPIASFESIANTTNLHFFFMSACLPIFLRKKVEKHETYLFFLFILVASLSTPLMIFYFPLLIFIRWNSRHSNFFKKLNPLEFAWSIGMLIQVLFVFTQAFGDRTSTGVQSATKTGFLYLDRVVGSALFPWWGNVSGSTASIAPNLFSAPVYLALRAMLAFTLFILVVLYIFKSSKSNMRVRTLTGGVLFTTIFYWFVVGIFFSPEPRYAIFPSFALLVILFYVQGEGLKKERIDFHQRVLIALIIFTWLGSWSPSQLRVNGPTWANEYEKARVECSAGARDVRIPIIPTNLKWFVVIDCEKIISN